MRYIYGGVWDPAKSEDLDLEVPRAVAGALSGFTFKTRAVY